jgi:heme ABC exporter ATP-binding subunit CcmA
VTGDGSPCPLALEGVTRRFGAVVALAGVDLAVQQGDTLLVAGPNGAGKSTLLRIACGLSRPTEGAVCLHGATHRRGVPAEARAEIGYLGHQSFLHEHLTARENLTLYGRLYGGGRELSASVQGWLERVGLARAADRVIAGFSRGMMQRLALARALIHRPRLLLLDEPATGLDAEGREMLEGVVGELAREGVTMMLVSHQLELGLRLASRVAVLRRGRLALDGPAAERSAEEWQREISGRPM